MMGLEPTTFGTTTRRSNQTELHSPKTLVNYQCQAILKHRMANGQVLAAKATLNSDYTTSFLYATRRL